MTSTDATSSFDCPHSPYLDITPSVMNPLGDDKHPSQGFSASVTHDSFANTIYDPLQAHLRAVLDDEYWNSHQNHMFSWWNKVFKPFSSDARSRRYDKHKAARSSTKTKVLLTAATSPMDSMDNSQHSNCIRVRPDAKMFREPIGMHLQHRTHTRPQGQEDLCNFLNLLNLNHHDRQHPSDPLILLSDEPPSVSLPLDFVKRPHKDGNFGSSAPIPSTHSLRRVDNIHDMSRQGSQSSCPVHLNDCSKPIDKEVIAQNGEHSASRRMSCSNAVPFPTTKKNPTNPDSHDVDPVLEDDSIAMAEYIYTKATWRMYDRIMAARIKAEEEKRKSQCYHSLPPICKVDKDHHISTIPPDLTKSVKSTYPIDEGTIDTVPMAFATEDADYDSSSSFLLGSSQSTCVEVKHKAHHPHVDHFDHESVVFNLDLDS